jgi:endonuclease/exonuclease/phosphatase family metal-dependent hydrolase
VINFDGVPLNVINTHLGLVPREQRLQAAALVGSSWLGHADCAGATLLTGDFNATSMTRPYQTLARRLADCQRELSLKPSVKTFPSTFPAIRIDHCFVSPEIEITGVKAPLSPLARTASDHLPLIVDFAFRRDAATAARAATGSDVSMA